MADEIGPLQTKLKDAIAANSDITPETTHELNKHLIEALTSKDPGMVGLGYDCLQEVIGLLDDDQRKLILDGWNEYFDNSPEFKDLMENHKSSKRLLDIYKNDVQPLKMKPKPIEKPEQSNLQSYLQSKDSV